MGRKRVVQGTLFRSRGGQPGRSGRKPNGERAGVSHRKRAPLASKFPVHVVVKLEKGLPSLRRRREYRTLCEAFAKGCEKHGFRLNQYSVQSNHLHLMVEAHGRRELSRGMQGLLIRIAKGLNRLWRRKGSVFADRYFDRILRSPLEVRNALAYVLNNARKHGIFTRAHDPYSSAERFDGWRRFIRSKAPLPPPWLPKAHTWLQRLGWRQHGLISATHTPGG
jgi:REP element-mobilizing transposase RayT